MIDAEIINTNIKKNLERVCSLLTLNLVVSWGYLIYDIITSLPLLIQLFDKSRSFIVLFLPKIVSIIGDIAAIVFIRKARYKIGQREDYAFCVIALIASSLLVSIVGSIIGLITLFLFITKVTSNEYSYSKSFTSVHNMEAELPDTLKPDNDPSCDIYR